MRHSRNGYAVLLVVVALVLLGLGLSPGAAGAAGSLVHNPVPSVWSPFGGGLGVVLEPTITSFSPGSGPIGTLVTINGTNFVDVGAVTFSGTAASAEVLSATQLRATVPAGAISGKIAVTTPGGTAESADSFSVVVVGAPSITDFSPVSGPSGTAVTITGTDFLGTTSVTFNGASASFNPAAVTATTIVATVPAGATTGPISVTTPSGTGTSVASFSVSGPTVTSFSPTSGEVGTTVTVTGTGFTGATAVEFGGVAATSFTVDSNTKITATVPAGALSGSISVTGTGGTGVSTTAFDVIPAISGFSPIKGPVGTVVTITGSGFNSATGVTFGGASAGTYTVNSSTQITAIVPSGAFTGKIGVTHPGGEVKSAATFTVEIVPPPAITGFSPTSGPVGTLVTISGTGFSGATTVTFDGIPADFTGVSATSITATVPAGASTGKIGVTTPGGSTLSSSNYTVTGPIITNFTPTSGPVGTLVTITGTGFSDVTGVTFNGTSATFSLVSATQITATVPVGATTGKIGMTSPGGSALSSANFTVTAPSITSFSPTTGPVGTLVTINGSGFGDVTGVTFNGTSATFSLVSATQITATVPVGATTGKIGVISPGGTELSSSNFTVTAPTIAGFSPGTGPVGTVVTITGTGLTGATAVTFNGVSATYTVNSSTQITATVPAAASTGPIVVTTPGGTATSSGSFTIPPTIAGFTPSGGYAGTQVTITGTGFTGATSVRFNGVTASLITVDSATQIAATVPVGATSGTIAVTTPSGTATSASSFNVLSPTITNFTPVSGPAGTVVTVTGSGFSGATAVRFNGQNAAAFEIDSATQIAATVPTGITTGPITVVTPSGTAISAVPFTAPSVGPVIANISPTWTAAYGQTALRLYVAGSGFESGAAQVFWNTTLLAAATPPAGPAPNPTAELYVTVPVVLLATPTTANITVRNPGSGMSSNVAQFNVLGPTIKSLSPNTASNTVANQEVFLDGTDLNLAVNPTLTLKGQTNTAAAGTTITVTDLTLLLGSNTRMGGRLNLATAGPGGTPAPPGPYDVTLTYSQEGSKSLTLAGGFTVNGSTFTEIEPKTTNNGQTAFTLTLKGAGLNTLTSPTVSLKGPGTTGTAAIVGTGVTVATGGASMTVVFNLAAPTVAPAGPYDVVITYAGSSTLKLPQALTVQNAAPVLSALNPTSVWAGSVKPTTLTITGSGFVPASQVLSATASAVQIGARVATNGTVVSGTQLTVPLQATDFAAPGSIPVSVINPATGTPAAGGGTSTVVNLTSLAETTMPVTTITGADTKWHNTPVTLNVIATDSQSGIQSTQYAIGAGSPWVTLTGPTITVPAPADHSGDGKKVVSAQSTDWCNKTETPAVTATVYIDTKGPSTSAWAASTVTKGKQLKLSYQANDTLSPTCDVTLKIKKASDGTVVKTFALGQVPSNTKGSKSFTCNLPKGKYKYYVYAKDLAGNKQTNVASVPVQVK